MSDNNRIIVQRRLSNERYDCFSMSPAGVAARAVRRQWRRENGLSTWPSGQYAHQDDFDGLNAALKSSSTLLRF